MRIMKMELMVAHLAFVLGFVGQVSSLEMVEQPLNQVVQLGKLAQFSCQGTPSLGVTARVNGTIYQEADLTTRLGIAIYNRSLTALTLKTTATYLNNSTVISCYASDPYGSLWSNPAILIVYGVPLAPAPNAHPLNATALTLKWHEPFSWSGPATILHYTVRMYNASNQAWTMWTIPAETSVTGYTITVATAGNVVQSVCAALTLMVSATNEAGEGANGTTSICLPKDINPDEIPLTADVLLHQNGTPEVIIRLQLPGACPGNVIGYNLTIKRGSDELLLAQGQHNGTASSYTFAYETDLMSGYTVILYTQAGDIENIKSIHFNTTFAGACGAYLMSDNYKSTTASRTLPTVALVVGISAPATILLGMGICVLILILKDQKKRPHNKNIKPVSATNPMNQNPIYEATIYDTIPGGGDYDSTNHKLKGNITTCRPTNRYSDTKIVSEKSSAMASEQYVYMEAPKNKQAETCSPSKGKALLPQDAYVSMQLCADSTQPKPPPLAAEVDSKEALQCNVLLN